ncbi:MAG TPA: efflux RND transporter permease subunit [Kofleriaceae bacterium]|nr:efflux RND transporter permease subunit [Kofleriaceae bacterium]
MKADRRGGEQVELPAHGSRLASGARRRAGVLAGAALGDNVQIGLVVLMGLATKNAILIVEFARELERQGRTVIEAAIEACRLRLRPIVMTSLAFIAGVVPLMLSHGPGAEIRRAMGVRCSPG